MLSMYLVAVLFFQPWGLDAGVAAMCLISAVANVRSEHKERVRRERIAEALKALNRFRKG